MDSATIMQRISKPHIKEEWGSDGPQCPYCESNFPEELGKGNYKCKTCRRFWEESKY